VIFCRAVIISLGLIVASICHADVLIDPHFDSIPKISRMREISIEYSPWIKVCGGQQLDVCLTVTEAYLKTGEFFGSAAVISDREGAKSTLRTILPLGVDLGRGIRMIVGESVPIYGKFSVCFPNGCMAEYVIASDLIAKLKTEETLALEAFDGSNQRPIYLFFPLSDFSRADSGAAISANEFEARRTEFAKSLQRKPSDSKR
jgi:invasion protein IalB